MSSALSSTRFRFIRYSVLKRFRFLRVLCRVRGLDLSGNLSARRFRFVR